ncbi:MAG: DNA helicase RecQ [Eggerthellaceae bacterium]|jgi:ATP-dependent DNA helicase RecQ|nr:DNA helicase RecQ [Eggerthellaceae bacterium]MDR2715466.1 DNA helicase RecQ [Coriobacteriaceae bacterium]
MGEAAVGEGPGGASKLEVLSACFGYDAFRPGQEALIDALLARRDVVGIMPTGAGKSLCYQVPALMMEGITIVVSPLIALMKDQVGALTQAGVAAAFINSSLRPQEVGEVIRDAKAGKYRIIYVAPERLSNPLFMGFCTAADIAMVTVDEAHCVSQWGHDFRPSYREIARFVAALPARPIVGAFTATATAQVRADIAELLALHDAYVLVSGFNRENLYFSVKRPKDKMATLLEFLGQRRDACGIVYCATRAGVEEVCAELVECGYAATRYHAGLDDGERLGNQDDFVYERSRIMVATNAFGMGIDKSNLAFVVHYNMPKNLESYYQEAGRAGRDGEPAVCLTLYSAQDVETGKFLISKSYEDGDHDWEARQARQANDLDLLKKMTWYCTTSDCLRGYILKYFGEQAPVFCGCCSNCDTQFEAVDVTIDAQKVISCVMRLERQNRAFGKALIAKSLHGSKDKQVTGRGLDKLSTYGIMAEVPVKRIMDIINYLVEKGWVSQSNSEYPTLGLTERSLEVIRGKAQVLMQLPKLPKAAESEEGSEAQAGTQAGGRAGVGSGSRAGGKDGAPAGTQAGMHGHPELYERLVALRRQLAEEAGMPAYIVFSNAALNDMCRKLPRTPEEFLSVNGVGQAKKEAYSAPFTQAIRDYCNNSQGQAPRVP